MKSSLVALSMICALLATACDRRTDPENAPESDVSTEAVAAPDASNPTASVEGDVTASSPAASNDALALGLLAAIDDHEIQAAQQAIGKNVAAPVMAYARMMEKAHTDNLVATKALGALADAPEVTAMKDKGAAERGELAKKSGKDYETAYVDAMVKGHAEVLTMIDGQLMTLASEGPVKEHLASTRGHVAMHLKAAQDLQANAAP